MESEKWLQELLNKFQECMGEEYEVKEVSKPVLNQCHLVKLLQFIST